MKQKWEEITKEGFYSSGELGTEVSTCSIPPSMWPPCLSLWLSITAFLLCVFLNLFHFFSFPNHSNFNMSFIRLGQKLRLSLERLFHLYPLSSLSRRPQTVTVHHHFYEPSSHLLFNLRRQCHFSWPLHGSWNLTGTSAQQFSHWCLQRAYICAAAMQNSNQGLQTAGLPNRI